MTETYDFDLTSTKTRCQDSYRQEADTIVLRLDNAPGVDLVYEFALISTTPLLAFACRASGVAQSLMYDAATARPAQASGCSISARISALSTMRGPGRL